MQEVFLGKLLSEGTRETRQHPNSDQPTIYIFPSLLQTKTTQTIEASLASLEAVPEQQSASNRAP